MKLNNYPALRFAIIFICGILVSSWMIGIIPSKSLLIASSILILAAALLILQLYRRNKDNSLSLVVLILIIFFLGIFRTSLDNNSGSYLSGIPEMYPKNSIELIGVVKDIPDYDDNRVKFPIECEKIISGKDTIVLTGTVLITSYKPVSGNHETKLPFIKAGDRLLIPGYVHDGAVEKNPGEFDYRKFLRIHNIDKLLTNNDCTTIEFISSGNLNFFYQKLIFPVKYYVFEQINKTIPGNEGAFLNGLITGIRSDITEDVKQDFINSGTAHIIAVSGLNVVYIVLIITLLLSLLRITLVPRTIITIILLIYYCFFTGVSPSIVRATIMGSLILIAYILQRKTSFLNIIGFSAIIILLIDPKQLFDNGFILSFASLTSIIIVHNKFEKLFLSKLKDRSENYFYRKLILVIELMAVTLAAIAGTLPFALAMFGKFSIVSLITNVIAIPLSNFSLAIGIFQILISLFSSVAAQFIAGVNFFLLKFLLLFISWSASFKYSSVKLPDIGIFSSVLYYIIFFGFLFISRKNIKYVLPVIFLSASAFIFHNMKSSELKITFLDVGQGDCSVIQTIDNKTILVDCGMNSMFVNSGERTILPYLQRDGIDKIDLLIITHLHMDHIGGLKYLLENIPVEKIYNSGQKVESEYVHSIDSLIAVKHIQNETIREGFEDSTFKDMRLYFMFPDDGFINSEGMTVGNNLNNGSLVFKLQYKNSSVLFSGDVEKYAEEDIVSRYSSMLKSDILKSPHHGSFTSSTIPFIDKVHPEYAVISCGKFNRFNHPSDIIVQRYKIMNINTERTDQDNAAVFEYKDGKFNEVKWK